MSCPINPGMANNGPAPAPAAEAVSGQVEHPWPENKGGVDCDVWKLSPESPKTVELILANLEGALARRKAKTPFVSDEQRGALQAQIGKMLETTSPAELAELLRLVRDDASYLAAAGNFNDFCHDILQLDAELVKALLDDVEEAPGEHRLVRNEDSVANADRTAPEAQPKPADAVPTDESPTRQAECDAPDTATGDKHEQDHAPTEKASGFPARGSRAGVARITNANKKAYMTETNEDPPDDRNEEEPARTGSAPRSAPPVRREEPERAETDQERASTAAPVRHPPVRHGPPPRRFVAETAQHDAGEPEEKRQPAYEPSNADLREASEVLAQATRAIDDAIYNLEGVGGKAERLKRRLDDMLGRTSRRPPPRRTNDPMRD